MKKKTIYIPDWAKDIVVISPGGEILTFTCEGDVWVKSKRCNKCGKCCIVNKEWSEGVKSGEEVGWSKDIVVCKYLKKEIWNFGVYKNETVYICTAGVNQPIKCMLGPGGCDFDDWKKTSEYCTIEYKKVL